MLSKLSKRRQDLTEKYMESAGLQKGFTLIEVLITIAIIIVLIVITVAAFNVFGRVDGTELNAQSKNVESAALQNALSDTEGTPREMPGFNSNDMDYENRLDAVTKYPQISSKNTIPTAGEATSFFDDYNSSKVVLEKVAEKAFKGKVDAGKELEALEGLLVPLDTGVQNSIAGEAKASDYLVVVKKSQLYKDSVAEYKNYNDSLAGTVFSKKTIIDGDGYYYNGTNKAKPASAPTN